MVERRSSLQEPKLPIKEKPVKRISLSTRKQQEAVLHGLWNHLREMTDLESVGRLNKNDIQQTEEIRDVVRTLADTLGRELTPAQSLVLGLTEKIPADQLEIYATLKHDKYGDRPLAQYLIEKKKKAESPTI